MKKRHILITLLTLIVAALFGAAVYADEPVEGRVGRAEVRFLEGMIDHHQMALDMAQDCLTKAETESIRTLCQNVIDAQSREILTMRGWLLSWYGVDYEPVSMLHSGAEADSGGAMGMGMMGEGGMDMMGMMSNMSEMMANMSGMMEMMSGGAMGMGMMGEGGMGMAGGANQMNPMSDMTMMRTLRMMSMMGTMTMGNMLEHTADLDATMPLMDVFDQLIAGMGTESDADAIMPMMESMTQGQMMSMFTEMHNLTMGDMREMVGHLEDGANATIMTLMGHHMEVMAGGAAQGEDATDHEAHHPAAGAEATPAASDHSQHQQDDTAQAGDHADHQGAGGAAQHSDPAMTMGMFAGLHALTGIDYEIAWIEAMIDHHDDAIHMAERILERAPEGVGHDQLRTMAQQIITDQSAEIASMEALIAELSS